MANRRLAVRRGEAVPECPKHATELIEHRSLLETNLRWIASYRGWFDRSSSHRWPLRCSSPVAASRRNTGPARSRVSRGF